MLCKFYLLLFAFFHCVFGSQITSKSKCLSVLCRQLLSRSGFRYVYFVFAEKGQSLEIRKVIPAASPFKENSVSNWECNNSRPTFPQHWSFKMCRSWTTKFCRSPDREGLESWSGRSWKPKLLLTSKKWVGLFSYFFVFDLLLYSIVCSSERICFCLFLSIHL